MERTRNSSNGASPLSGSSSDQEFHSCGSNSSIEEEDIQPARRKRRHITSDHEPPVVTTLTIEDLNEVLEMIKKHHSDVTKYEEIGLSLGLFKTTINAIKEECRGDPHKCLRQVFEKWLSRVDKVNKKGIPTWLTLIKKIRLIDNAAAGRIHDDIHPACRILKSVLQDQSVMKALPYFSMLLFHEDIIDEVHIPVEAASLLQEIKKSVCHNHENLKKFASLLKKYKCTAKVGRALMKEYISKISGDSEMTQEEKGLVSIDISRSSSSEFSDMRIHLGSTFRAVDKAICSINPPLDCKEIKKFICFIRSDLKVEIDTCVEVDEVLLVIREHCSLLDIKLLEAIVKEFNIEGAKKAVQDYKACLKIFSDKVKGKFCLEQKIALCSSLKCETITVTVDKDVEQICFEDIDVLMKLAFETLSSNIRVHVIRRDNSFTITCSFPLTLSASLISMALKNLKVLKEKGIIKLTIGYCTVYDYKEDTFYTKEGEAKDSSDEELQDYITSVYTSRGTLEQLLVSTSVQLMNSEEETTSLNEEMLKMKMKAESMEESLEDKSRMLSAIMRENEKFKRIADETIKLVQEKMKHETENETLKETIHLLEEQLALFQSEKEEPKDDDIKMPKAKDQELEELKIELAKSKEEMKTFQAEKSKEIEALQEKVSSLSVQLLPKQHSDESCQTDLDQSAQSEVIPKKDQATQSMEVLLPEIDGEQIKVEGMLTIDDLAEIIDLLQRCHFPETKWYILGLNLGLFLTTLKIIEMNYSRDMSRCLVECLSQWLRRADKVDSRGRATWDSLSTALRSIGEITVADELDQEKLLPSLALSLYSSYHPLLSQSLSDPISVARLLYGEHVIAGSVLSDVESASPSLPKQREVLLSVVREAVQSRHTSLRKFASVLCKFTDNVQIGEAILRDYRKFISSKEEFDEAKIQPENIKIHIPWSKGMESNSIMTPFAHMIYSVSRAVMESLHLDRLKGFLYVYRSDLKAKLDNCDSISSVVELISEECSLTDITLLEAVVEHFNITEAKEYIEEYKSKLEEFYQSLPFRVRENFEAVETSPLICETATFVFDRGPDEKDLQTITDILAKYTDKPVKINCIYAAN